MHRNQRSYSELISFRIDWLDLLAVKSLLQHYSSKASIVQHTAFFIVQITHSYMTIGKTTALTRQTFAGKVMFQLINMLSSLVIAFLPRNKCVLISWLQSPSAGILEPKKIKSLTVSMFSPIYLPWNNGTNLVLDQPKAGAQLIFTLWNWIENKKEWKEERRRKE